MNSFKTKAGTELPIIQLKGKDYLQVAHRLVWFREEHPDWSISTESKVMTDKLCVFKAEIRDNAGLLLASAHKSETPQGFGDYIEKAETGAIGRALAYCGYGTQFAEPDLDEGDRIVDSPLDRSGSPEGRVNPHAARNNQPGPEDGDPSRDQGYLIPFGKFQKRHLEEIPLDQLRSYIGWLEGEAEKKGQPLGAKQIDFIDRASHHIAALENAPLE